VYLTTSKWTTKNRTSWKR